jgi:membrane-associated phospholipid phosphatase
VDGRTLAQGAGLGAAALAVGVAASSGRGRAVDEDAFRMLNRDAGPTADRLFAGVTELGSIWASVGAAAVLAATGRRRAAVMGLTAASATWLLGQGAKKLFLRPRPYEADPGSVRLLVDPPNATSWPSSHPAVLLSFLTVAGREAGLPRAARAALGGLAGVVGASRVYVGVHYPADVAGGLLLGRAVADAVSPGPPVDSAA